MNIETRFRAISSSTVITLVHISEEDRCAMKLMFSGLEFTEMDESFINVGKEYNKVPTRDMAI